MWRHLKFLYMWRNFQFPYNCHTWKAEISPHDKFFSTNIIRDIRDKYQVLSDDNDDDSYGGNDGDDSDGQPGLVKNLLAQLDLECCCGPEN